jgi:hypothetical protein
MSSSCEEEKIPSNGSHSTKEAEEHKNSTQASGTLEGARDSQTDTGDSLQTESEIVRSGPRESVEHVPDENAKSQQSSKP